MTGSIYVVENGFQLVPVLSSKGQVNTAMNIVFSRVVLCLTTAAILYRGCH